MIQKGRGSWLAIALTLALAVLALLALHTVRHAMRLRRGSEPVRPWMSVPYIARSHRVPPALLYQALGLDPDRRDRRPLGRIARAQNRPVRDLLGAVNDVIARVHRRPPRPLNGSPP